MFVVGVNPGKGWAQRCRSHTKEFSWVSGSPWMVFFSFWLVARAGISKKVALPDSYSPISMEALGFHHLLGMESLKDKEWLLFLVLGNALLPFQ